MKKYTILSVSIACLLATSAIPAHSAQKFITLKDGSVIKGTVAGIANQKYTIETNNLGTIEVSESDIESITTSKVAQATKVPVAQNALGGLGNPGGSGNLGTSGQMQQMQNTLMSDPQMMAEIQTMLQDKELMALLSDPNIIQDLMSNDPSVIQNNPKIMQLMNNPQMKALMQMMINKGIGQR